MLLSLAFIVLLLLLIIYAYTCSQKLIPILGFLRTGYSSLSCAFRRFPPPGEILKSGMGITFWVPRPPCGATRAGASNYEKAAALVVIWLVLVLALVLVLVLVRVLLMITIIIIIILIIIRARASN